MTRLFFLLKLKKQVYLLTTDVCRWIVRQCLWAADRLAYVVMKLEAKSER